MDEATLSSAVTDLARSVATFSVAAAAFGLDARELRSDVSRLARTSRRFLSAFVIASILFASGLVGLLVIAGGNRSVLDLVRSAVTPGQEIYERAKTAQGDAVTVIVLETECRTRRIVVGLPPVPEDQPCRGMADNP